MKKTYIQPSIMTAYIGTMNIICGSQDITSSKGINYGGVDGDGTIDPDSRSYDGDWDD